MIKILININKKVTSNITTYIGIETKLNLTDINKRVYKRFDIVHIILYYIIYIIFIGAKYFVKDKSQNHLIFETLLKYFKVSRTSVKLNLMTRRTIGLSDEKY